MTEPGKAVGEHYDAVAADYHLQYDRDLLSDTRRSYPANYFRLQTLLDSFSRKGMKRVIEVGVGEGTPLAALAGNGIDVWGFDISRRMVEACKKRMVENRLDPEHVCWGDIQDPSSYSHMLKEGAFDGLMAMGVMPHVDDDDFVLRNMAALVRPGGTVFIEFRNKLFSLFSFNKHTLEFVLDDLLKGVSPELKQLVDDDLRPRLRMDMPPRRETVNGTDVPGHDAIRSKFHNPFEVVEMFSRHGLAGIELHWYHYHATMPHLAEKKPGLFREQSMLMEHETSKWRGYFLCSAFVVEAVKAGGPVNA